MKTLKEVKCGETVSVTKLMGTGAVKRRIMDMGITKGTQIYVRKVAPLGDPLEINRLFGHALDLEVDGGLLTTDVSSVVSLVGKEPELLREGAGDLSWLTG